MSNGNPAPFQVKDCALAAISTGINAQSLLELRDNLATIPPSCIYYHFWGGRLRTSFEYREYHNDFSFWVHHVLHDDILAERLEVLDPTDFANMEHLRSELVDIVENRLDELETVPWVKKEERFHFVKSKIIVFQTHELIKEPYELVQVFPRLTRSSLFYHFIDSARRLPGHKDDFSTWLEGFQDKHQALIASLRKIDPYLISLALLQEKIVSIANEYFVMK